MKIINKLSNQQLKELINIAKNALINYTEISGGYGYRYYHCVRVMNLCKKLLRYDEIKEQIKTIDEQALLISALFHDVGVIVNKKEVNSNYHEQHEVNGSKMVNRLLSNHLNKKTITKISKIILEHHTIKPEYQETLILQDADKLDETGLINVWRMISYASYTKKSLKDQMNYYFNHEQERLKKKITNNEFHFQITKKIAEQRLNKTTSFMNEIKEETTGGDFL